MPKTDSGQGLNWHISHKTNERKNGGTYKQYEELKWDTTSITET